MEFNRSALSNVSAYESMLMSWIKFDELHVQCTLYVLLISDVIFLSFNQNHNSWMIAKQTGY